MGSWLWLQPAAVRGHGLRLCIGVVAVRDHGLLAVAMFGNRSWPWASAVRCPQAAAGGKDGSRARPCAPGCGYSRQLCVAMGCGFVEG